MVEHPDIVITMQQKEPVMRKYLIMIKGMWVKVTSIAMLQFMTSCFHNIMLDQACRKQPAQANTVSRPLRAPRFASLSETIHKQCEDWSMIDISRALQEQLCSLTALIHAANRVYSAYHLACAEPNEYV